MHDASMMSVITAYTMRWLNFAEALLLCLARHELMLSSVSFDGSWKYFTAGILHSLSLSSYMLDNVLSRRQICRLPTQVKGPHWHFSLTCNICWETIGFRFQIPTSHKAGVAITVWQMECKQIFTWVCRQGTVPGIIHEKRVQLGFQENTGRCV